ncbi:hypothetical protein [Rhizosphaericola mali]|uniref:Uncharacterized protein n=1 Tax=Rhizosphaericola mali TaxID=2545455 RepID=A0A5P2GBZ3_9BACT|nr:hypothetical protein [Rhizosphaericola mali]QES90733.1 hypothetical protein E0W69_019435 [Rhizosphaericola mali]
MSCAFFFRILIGITYGYLYSHIKSDLSDTWKFFLHAKDQIGIFQEHPLSFFTYDIIDHHIYSGSLTKDLFKQDQSFFNDLHDILFIRVVILFNFLSGNRYYANVILFNIWTIWGSINMGKWLLNYLPSNKRIIIFFLFLFPSFLFWNCGVHRDGLAFWVLSTILLSTHNLLSKDYSLISIWRSLFLFIQIVFLLVFKIYWVILLVPFLTLFYFVEKRKLKNSILIFSLFTVGGILFFALSIYFPNSFKLSEKLAEKQYAFLSEVHGTIKLQLPYLTSSILSYFAILPSSLRNLILTPSFKDWFSSVGILALFGQAFFWSFILLALVFPKRNWKSIINTPVVVFFLFFSLSNMLLIGITIPYLSALIRYIVNFQTFILIILGYIIDWYKIADLRIFKNININKFAKK